MVLNLLGESRRETKWPKEALKGQIETIREPKEIITRQEETVQEMGRQVVEIADVRGTTASPRAARNYRDELDRY